MKVGAGNQAVLTPLSKNLLCVTCDTTETMVYSLQQHSRENIHALKQSSQLV